ncbi:MAG: Na+/H+ antiporter NhaA [Candidatus Heimdallarchaeota archaeon]
MVKHPSQPFPTRKKVPIERLMTPFQKFLQYEASSGLILIFTIVVALIWVNLDASSYFGVWETPFTISFGNFTISKEINLWINDLLMSLFFLVIGLEIKSELLVGDLRDPKKAMLPISAAIGGIILPASIYLIFNYKNAKYVDGWAIPAATDIAFALGILYLLGTKVPVTARIFLATLAIIDDIIAILIIAIFYTEEVKFDFIILATVMFLFLIVLNRLNVRRILPYMLVGSILWYGFFGSGIHATIAGIFLAMTIPATTKIDHIEFSKKSNKIITELVTLTKNNELSAKDLPLYMSSIAALEHTCHEIEAPLQRLEHTLVPWVTFVIMPIFALGNAGVVISGELLLRTSDSLSLGIIFGLVIGKPIGVVITSYIAVKLKIAKLPIGISWRQVLGIGFLAGIGFTMSTFIATLAFETDPVALEISKLAILIASFLSGVIGFSLLRNS